MVGKGVLVCCMTSLRKWSISLGLVLNNKLFRTEHIRYVHETCSSVRMADYVGDFNGLQSRQFSLVPFSHVRNMRLKFGVEDHAMQSLRRLQYSFSKTWDPLACTTEPICLSLSGSALQDEIKTCTTVLMLISSPPPPPLASTTTRSGYSFQNQDMQFQQQGTIHIVALCPTVNSPLERTSEGNPGVRYAVEVQNPI